ncbi:sugar transporter SWEET1 isoform X2 [Colletes latitarsis]|uniref:sugar transporter SWEET1 isoform X2 n=1 Tax=Colletes latitarsis TaxID=2605962 RepID=UPI0040359241
MGLEDYKEVVGTCASITTMGQMLAGTLICKDIYRKGSSKGVDPMPFLGGIGLCILMLQYAFILKDLTMVNINIFGCLTNTMYMAVYYYFTPNTGEIVKTKNTDILPFPLILMGTLVSFQWLLYGVIIDNGFVIFQNAVGFFLSVVQLSMFAIFPSKSKANSTSQKKTK